MPESKITKSNDWEKKRTIGELIRSIRDFLLPQSEFRKFSRKANQYIHLDRSTAPYKGLQREIPVTNGKTVNFTVASESYDTDRPINAYQEMLFPDEYDVLSQAESNQIYGSGWSITFFLSEAPKKKNPAPVAGGIEKAFRAGNTVLDLGSGEAVGLTQFALNFPHTTFIGVDINYDNTTMINLSQPGLQLVKDDWYQSKSIPDHSIDTIISLEAALRWGAQTPEDAARLITEIDRISKEGTVFRGSWTLNNTDSNFILEIFRHHGWQAQMIEGCIIAEKVSHTTP